MIGIPALSPYEGYTLYKTFHKSEKRYLAVLVKPEHRTTISYGKYMLETSLGRKLREGYETHHRDENKLNDAVSNLEEKLGTLHSAEHKLKPIRHGSAAGYRRGCRCSDCWNGQKESNRLWKEKKFTNISSTG